jgi:hypothetical protein
MPAGKVKAEPAPSAADVEHPMPRLQQQLVGDVLPLGLLGFFQAYAGAGEVGAGILLVAIEEEPVDPVVDVIVVGHIAPRLEQVVALEQLPVSGSHRSQKPAPR